MGPEGLGRRQAQVIGFPRASRSGLGKRRDPSGGADRIRPLHRDTPRHAAEFRAGRNSDCTATIADAARFTPVAAMNPWPCGHFADVAHRCSSSCQIARYLARISAPLLDRIDIQIEVSRPPTRTCSRWPPGKAACPSGSGSVPRAPSSKPLPGRRQQGQQRAEGGGSCLCERGDGSAADPAALPDRRGGEGTAAGGDPVVGAVGTSLRPHPEAGTHGGGPGGKVQSRPLRLRRRPDRWQRLPSWGR
jgi:hypothetical protein